MGQQIFEQDISELYVNSVTTVILPPSTVNVGGQQFTSTANIPLNTSVVGLNGLDTGPVVINSFYYVYAVFASGVPGLVASLLTPLTGPSGFPQYKRIGGFTTDGSGNIVSAWGRSRSPFLITTSGNYTVPYGLDFFKIKAVGGGGAGGGSTSSGGGAAGGYFESVFKNIAAGTVIPITIGVAGVGTGAGGGDTIVGGPINLTAQGGGGGASAGGGGVFGGTGGGVTGSVTADVIAVQGQPGGGGYGAGGQDVNGDGGSSALFGGGGRGNAFTPATGRAAVSYGSGGGGAYASTGWAGSQGVVLIEEHYK